MDKSSHQKERKRLTDRWTERERERLAVRQRDGEREKAREREKFTLKQPSRQLLSQTDRHSSVYWVGFFLVVFWGGCIQ